MFLQPMSCAQLIARIIITFNRGRISSDDCLNVILYNVQISYIKYLMVIQNNALRIILKKNRIDHVSIISMLEQAKITSLKERMKSFLLNYYSKAMFYRNPLITELTNEYWQFRARKIKSDPNSEEHKTEINRLKNSSEKIETILCYINQELNTLNSNQTVTSNAEGEP